MADPSARITQVSSLVASPGCCAICGKSNHPEGFAATDNFDFDGYGTVYFCADCIGDYARVFGYKSPSELDDVQGQLDSQRVELATLRQAVVLLENALDNFTGLSNLRRDHIIPGDSVGNVLVVPEPAVVESNPEPVSVGEGDQLPFDEPNSEPGPDDVRDLASSDSSIDELLAL